MGRLGKNERAWRADPCRNNLTIIPGIFGRNAQKYIFFEGTLLSDKQTTALDERHGFAFQQWLAQLGSEQLSLSLFSLSLFLSFSLSLFLSFSLSLFLSFLLRGPNSNNPFSRIINADPLTNTLRGQNIFINRVPGGQMGPAGEKHTRPLNQARKKHFRLFGREHEGTTVQFKLRITSQE